MQLTLTCFTLKSWSLSNVPRILPFRISLQFLHFLIQQFHTFSSLLKFPIPPILSLLSSCSCHVQFHEKIKAIRREFRKLSWPQLPVFKHPAPVLYLLPFIKHKLCVSIRSDPLSIAQGRHSSNSVPPFLHDHCSFAHCIFSTNTKMLSSLS